MRKSGALLRLAGWLAWRNEQQHSSNGGRPGSCGGRVGGGRQGVQGTAQGAGQCLGVRLFLCGRELEQILR